MVEELRGKKVECLKLEGNTLGIDAAEMIGKALASHPEFTRAHWKDLFTGRLKTEIPQALVRTQSEFDRFILYLDNEKSRV